MTLARIRKPPQEESLQISCTNMFGVKNLKGKSKAQVRTNRIDRVAVRSPMRRPRKYDATRTGR
jgi:hypothetical protein